MQKILMLVALCALASCGLPQAATTQDIRVLFIGNSLTYANDLPGTVAEIAKANGIALHAEMVALPNLALIDHVNGASNAIARIREGHWDYVVLQQGPTSLPVDRDTLVLAVRQLDAEIRKVNAKTAVYMVWPSKDRLQFFDAVHASHQAAADAVNGILMPAGDAWRIAWQRDATLVFYAADDFHPSTLGTYAAALVIFECMARRTPAMGRNSVVETAAHDAASICR